MVNYINVAQAANALNLYEFDIRTDGAYLYAVDDVITCVTSTTTFVIRRVVSQSRYFVDTHGSIAPIIGEVIGLSGGDLNTSKIQASDFILLDGAVKRAQGLIEAITHKKLLTQSETKTERITLKKRKVSYGLLKYPVISVTSITIAGQVYSGTEDQLDGQGGDYYLDKEGALFEFKVERTKRALMEIEYLWGYNDTPANLAADLPQIIVDAMQKIVRQIWDRYVIESTAHGATSVSPGQFSINFNFEPTFTEDLKQMLSNQMRILIR